MLYALKQVCRSYNYLKNTKNLKLLVNLKKVLKDFPRSVIYMHHGWPCNMAKRMLARLKYYPREDVLHYFLTTILYLLRRIQQYIKIQNSCATFSLHIFTKCQVAFVIDIACMKCHLRNLKRSELDEKNAYVFLILIVQ